MTGQQSPEESLRATVKHLYASFSRYHLRPQIEERSRHFVSNNLRELLYATSLQALDTVVLGRYVSDAVLDLGDEKDFKHFLPRLFELLAFDERGLDEICLLRRLRYADWRKWPRLEQKAIETFLIAWWQSILSSDSGRTSADDCLVSIAQVIDDLTPYLEAWERDRSLPALYHLVRFVNWNSPDLLNGRLLGAWWDDRREQMEQAITWLLHPARVTSLEEASFEVFADGPFEAECSQAVYWLKEAHKWSV